MAEFSYYRTVDKHFTVFFLLYVSFSFTTKKTIQLYEL